MVSIRVSRKEKSNTGRIKVILKKVAHLFAKKHIYDAYGSQNFLRIKSGIDPKSLNKAIRSMR